MVRVLSIMGNSDNKANFGDPSALFLRNSIFSSVIYSQDKYEK